MPSTTREHINQCQPLSTAGVVNIISELDVCEGGFNKEGTMSLQQMMGNPRIPSTKREHVQ